MPFDHTLHAMRRILEKLEALGVGPSEARRDFMALIHAELEYAAEFGVERGVEAERRE
jgi:hypothetical protein